MRSFATDVLVCLCILHRLLRHRASAGSGTLRAWDTRYETRTLRRGGDSVPKRLATEPATRRGILRTRRSVSAAGQNRRCGGCISSRLDTARAAKDARCRASLSGAHLPLARQICRCGEARAKRRLAAAEDSRIFPTLGQCLRPEREVNSGAAGVSEGNRAGCLPRGGVSGNRAHRFHAG